MTGPTDEPTEADPYQVARLFHETYERLAPSFGYETRKASAVQWDDVPEQNRRLMVAVADEVLRALVGGRSAAPTRDEWADAARELLAAMHDPMDPSQWLDADGNTVLAEFLRIVGEKADRQRRAEEAVLDLLSRSAAEPPRGRVGVAALIETLAEGLAAYEGTDESDVHRSMARHLVGWFIAEGWRVWRLSPEDRGVAAEPNEEDGDG